MIVQDVGSTDTIIVVPTLGQSQRLKYLDELLQSLEVQSYPIAVEVLSPEFPIDFADVLDRYPNVRRKRVQGNLAAAVNSALLGRKDFKFGNWIGDDDRLPANSVAFAHMAISSSDDHVLAFGRCDYIDENGCVLFGSSIDRFAAKLNPFVPAAIKLEGGLFRLAAFEAVGGLDTSLRLGPDVDLVLKLQQLGKVVPIMRCVAEFRLHQGSVTTSQRRMQLREAQEIQRRYLKGPSLMIHRVLSPVICLGLWIFFQTFARLKARRGFTIRSSRKDQEGTSSSS